MMLLPFPLIPQTSIISWKCLVKGHITSSVNQCMVYSVLHFIHQPCIEDSGLIMSHLNQLEQCWALSMTQTLLTNGLFPHHLLAANITLMEKVSCPRKKYSGQSTVRAIEKEENVRMGVFRPFALAWCVKTSSQRKLILPLPSAQQKLCGHISTYRAGVI